MCKTTTMDHSCGCPPSKDWSPCPAVHEGKECTGEEEAVEKIEEPCKECQAEAKLLEESLRKIAEDEKLAPVPKSNAAAEGENQGPKQYFIEVMRWEKCNHISHPSQTSIERDPLDPPYIETPGPGLCWSCAEAHPSTLKTMQEAGTYNQDDPWGAMTQDHPNTADTAPLAGPSGLQQKPISHRAMAMGLDDRGLAEFDSMQRAKADMMKGARAGKHHDDGSSPPPPHYEQSPEVVGKGKGRDGHPNDTYGKRYGAVDPFVDSDDDDNKYDSDPVGDDDDEVEEQPSMGRMPPRAESAHHPARNQVHKPSRQDAEDDEDEYEESKEEEDTRASQPPDWSSKPSIPTSGSNPPISDPTTNGSLHHNDSPSKINHNNQEVHPSDNDTEEESSSEPDESPTQNPLRPRYQPPPQQQPPQARTSNRSSLHAANGPVQGAIPNSSSSSSSGGGNAKKRPGAPHHPPKYEAPEDEGEDEDDEEESEEDSDDYKRGKGKGRKRGGR